MYASFLSVTACFVFVAIFQLNVIVYFICPQESEYVYTLNYH